MYSLPPIGGCLKMSELHVSLRKKVCRIAEINQAKG